MVKLLETLSRFKKIFKTKVSLILPVTIIKRFSLLQTIKGINFGLFRMYVTPYRISWIINLRPKVTIHCIYIPFRGICE